MQILQRLVSSYWPAISRTDLAWIRGSRERLLHVVVRTYGLNREAAERQIRAFSELIKLPASDRANVESTIAPPHFPAQAAEVDMVIQQQQSLPLSQPSESNAAVGEHGDNPGEQPPPATDKTVLE